MRRKIPIFAGAAVAALLLGGCGRVTKASGGDPAKVTVEEAQDLSIVSVPDSNSFPLVVVTQRAAVSQLSVNGVIAPDVTRSVAVLSLSGGRAAEIRAKLGDEVKQGQTLVLINSPDVSQAFSDYQKAVADEVLSRKQLERAQLLLSKGAMAAKEVEAAEDAENKAKVDLNTTAERIRLLGADVNHPSPLIEIKAPIAGTIVEQNVSGGTGVRSLDNSPNLFTVADLSRVWLLCDVYENNLSQVHVGDHANVRLNAYPDRLIRGRVSNIGQVLDPVTRAAKVRLELDNPGGLMRMGMFASATFVSTTSHLQAIVPSTAVLRLHDKDWVFIPLGEKRFRRVEIQAGPAGADGTQQVLSGLRTGDKIVSKALQISSTGDSE